MGRADRPHFAVRVGIDPERLTHRLRAIPFDATRHDRERAAVRQLQAETNGDIEVSGAKLAASLIRFGLVDEFRPYVMPVVLGGGKPYFEAGQLELTPLGVEPAARLHARGAPRAGS